MELLIEALITGKMWLKHKVLEKPGDMRQVPFGRTDVRHALHHTIFRLEVLAQRHRHRTNLLITFG